MECPATIATLPVIEPKDEPQRTRAAHLKQKGLLSFSPDHGSVVERWYAREIDTLESQLRRFVFQTEELANSESASLSVYRVYGRVKSARSIVAKLVKLANSTTSSERSRKGAACRLLSANSLDAISSADVFLCIPDLLGLRVVTLFAVDRERFLKHLVAASSIGQLAIAKSPNGDISIQRHVPSFDGDSVEHEHGEINRTESGYSSIHVGVLLPRTLSPQPGHSKVGRSVIPAELQIRTIAEEAWAHASHLLLYKSHSRSNDAAQSLRTIKRQLAPIDEQLQTLYGAFQLRNRANGWLPWIQLSRYYEIDIPKSIGSGKFRTAYTNARAKYRAMNIPEALVLYSELLKNVKSFERDMSPQDFRTIKIELQYHIALQRLYLLDGSEADRSEVEGLFQDILKTRRSHALAKFRLAYLYESRAREDRGKSLAHLRKAVSLATEALEAFESGREATLRHGQRGLVAEMLAYRGSLYFRMADFLSSKIGEAGSTGGRRNRVPLKMTAALEDSYDDTTAALAILDQEPEDAEHAPLRLRCINNLCYYHTQLGSLEIAREMRDIILKLPHGIDNPLVLDTLACLLLKEDRGSGEAVELWNEATHLIDLSGKSDLPHVRRFTNTIATHKDQGLRAVGQL